MYTEFYGLAERPFELTPDPRYLYLSAHHREALAHLTYGVQERKGFVQLTGEVGTGKTTMLDALTINLDVSARVARLSHTTIDSLDLLRVLGRDLGIASGEASKSELLIRIGEVLEELAASGRSAVFVIDEAQDLSLEVLEEIRLLSNLRVDGVPAVQIVLAGQPELREKLARQELRQLRQRIGIRYHLTPLSETETAEYVRHRLAVAGAEDRDIFDGSALRAIFESSAGVPRLVNTVCDRALLAGYADGRKRVTRAIVLEAADAVQGVSAPAPAGPRSRSRAPTPPRGARRSRWLIPVAAAGVIAVAAFLTANGGWRPGAPPRERDGGRPEGSATAASPAGEVSAAVSLEHSDGGAEGAGAVVAEEAVGPDSAAVAAADTTADRPAVDAAPAVGDLERGRAIAAPRAGPGGPLLVVAVSTQSEDAARSEAAALEAAGFAARVAGADLGERGVWYRVVIDGGFPTLDAARDVVSSLQDIGYEEAWILRE